MRTQLHTAAPPFVSQCGATSGALPVCLPECPLFILPFAPRSLWETAPAPCLIGLSASCLGPSPLPQKFLFSSFTSRCLQQAVTLVTLGENVPVATFLPKCHITILRLGCSDQATRWCQCLVVIFDVRLERKRSEQMGFDVAAVFSMLP